MLQIYGNDAKKTAEDYLPFSGSKSVSISECYFSDSSEEIFQILELNYVKY